MRGCSRPVQAASVGNGRHCGDFLMSATTALTQEECLTHLASIAGKEHTQLCGETVAVAAADGQQIAEILRFADANSIAVTAVGGGTKLGWGNQIGRAAGRE